MLSLGSSPFEAIDGSGRDQNHACSMPSFLQQVDISLNLDKINKLSSASTNAITMKLNNKKQRNELKDPKHQRTMPQHACICAMMNGRH